MGAPHGGPRRSRRGPPLMCPGTSGCTVPCGKRWCPPLAEPAASSRSGDERTSETGPYISGVLLCEVGGQCGGAVFHDGCGAVDEFPADAGLGAGDGDGHAGGCAFDGGCDAAYADFLFAVVDGEALSADVGEFGGKGLGCGDGAV